MRFIAKTLYVIVGLLIIPAIASSQVDHFGIIDTLYVDVARIDATNWTLTISLTNDEFIEGMSIPLKMTAGMTRIVADSAIYTGGRVEEFAFKGFRPDTAIQCVTLGLVANLGPPKVKLPPGSGRLVTVFVSSLDGTPIDKLVVDTTTTNPNNSLLAVVRRIQLTDPPETISYERRGELELIPAFVVRQSK